MQNVLIEYARFMKNTVIIFVSHSIPQIARVANKLCVLDKGNIVFYGQDIPKGINVYTSLFDKTKKSITEMARLLLIELM